ncbi:hypothetical protein [Mycobacterium sp.]|uniref:hypothetical protein n=1 Tax=Mycobacterium sp. TaxID=1785 RepID=UPI003F94BB08
MFDTLKDTDPAALVAVVESTHREESALVALPKPFSKVRHLVRMVGEVGVSSTKM